MKKGLDFNDLFINIIFYNFLPIKKLKYRDYDGATKSGTQDKIQLSSTLLARQQTLDNTMFPPPY